MRESVMRQKSYNSVLFALLIVGSAALPVRGAVVLLDAETDRDVAAIVPPGPGNLRSRALPPHPRRGFGAASGVRPAVHHGWAKR